MDRAGFELAGDDRGVLCLHGFTATPHDMRFVGEALAARGLTVRAIALPGHATHVRDLEPVSWRDWVAAVAAAYDDLAARCRRVAVVGQSLGGLLALHLATTRPVAAVASLAAPLWLDGLSGWIARVTTSTPLGRWVRYLPKPGGPDIRDPDERRTNPTYDRIPVRALGQVMDFIPRVEAVLPAVRAPLLILHAVHDHTAPLASARRIAERCASVDLRVRILPESFHVISVDVERAIVAAEVGAFFARTIGS